MGYGFPAAIGAKMGRPECDVIDVAGDGSFLMNSQELATAVVNDIPVKVAVLNNGCLGMVRQWQELFFEKRYSATILGRTSPDFVKLAEAYGAVGLRATKPSEVEAVIRSRNGHGQAGGHGLHSQSGGEGLAHGSCRSYARARFWIWSGVMMPNPAIWRRSMPKEGKMSWARRGSR